MSAWTENIDSMQEMMDLIQRYRPVADDVTTEVEETVGGTIIRAKQLDQSNEGGDADTSRQILKGTDGSGNVTYTCPSVLLYSWGGLGFTEGFSSTRGFELRFDSIPAAHGVTFTFPAGTDTVTIGYNMDIGYYHTNINGVDAVTQKFYTASNHTMWDAVVYHEQTGSGVLLNGFPERIDPPRYMNDIAFRFITTGTTPETIQVTNVGIYTPYAQYFATVGTSPEIRYEMSVAVSPSDLFTFYAKWPEDWWTEYNDIPPNVWPAIVSLSNPQVAGFYTELIGSLTFNADRIPTGAQHARRSLVPPPFSNDNFTTLDSSTRGIVTGGS